MRVTSRLVAAATAALGAPAAAQPCVPVWTPVGAPQVSQFAVTTLTAWDPDGPGPRLAILAVGRQHVSKTPGIDQWDGSKWSPLARQVGGTVFALSTYDPDGPGGAPPLLAAGGTFTSIEGVAANRVAVWDGVSWRALGSGLAGISPWVMALVQWNGDLVAAGSFNSAGGIAVQGLARWDGVAWHGFADETANQPNALLVWNGSLIAGRGFVLPGGSSAAGVLRWTGQAWETLGTNYPWGVVHALTTYRGDLVAGGSFSGSGSPGNHVARFDGVTWHPLGSGVNGQVRALESFDPDGAGPLPELLIVGGSISEAGGVPVFGIAAWDGAQWSALGSSLNNAAEALAVYQGRLAVGGNFGLAGGQWSPYFAVYGCPAPCYADCNQDGVLNLADFGCFQTMFSIGDPYADCNGDGVRNLADFGCFMTKFGLGCP